MEPTPAPDIPELFNVRWNCEHFSATIRNAFTEMLERKTFTDVTISCEDGRVDCHRVVLSACSPYFAELLINERNADSHMVICLVGVNSWQLHAMISFMYRGEVSKITRDQFDELGNVANRFRIQGFAMHNETPMMRTREERHSSTTTETESSSEQEAVLPTTRLNKRKRNRKKCFAPIKVRSEHVSPGSSNNNNISGENVGDKVANVTQHHPSSGQYDDESDKISVGAADEQADQVSNNSVQAEGNRSNKDSTNKVVFREHHLNNNNASSPTGAVPSLLGLHLAKVTNDHHYRPPLLSSSVPVPTPTIMNLNVSEHDLHLRFMYASYWTFYGLSIGQAAALYGLSELALSEYLVQQSAAINAPSPQQPVKRRRSKR